MKSKPEVIDVEREEVSMRSRVESRERLRVDSLQHHGCARGGTTRSTKKRSCKDLYYKKIFMVAQKPQRPTSICRKTARKSVKS